MKKYIGPITLTLIFFTLIIGRLFQDTSHPDDHEVKGFDYLTQPDDITCGPTSAAMLLRYYGKDVEINEVKARTKTVWFRWDGKDIGMTSPDYVEIALRHYGVPAKLKRGSIDNLKHFISQGRPPVVLVRSGDTNWHYVVAIGYTQDKIFVADPGDGARFDMPVEHFLGCWSFQTDMYGNPTGLTCPVCGGDGYYWSRFRIPCDFCNGRKMVDPLKDLLRAGDVFPQTMIVPENPK